MAENKPKLHWRQDPKNKAKIERANRRAARTLKAHNRAERRHHKAAPGTHYGNPTGTRQHFANPRRQNVTIPLPPMFVEAADMEAKRTKQTTAAFLASALYEHFGFIDAE